ncbi:MAG: glycoside hydrolase family protein [bacterium]|nr:glycoside hydrolase family protein [bacterium]
MIHAGDPVLRDMLRKHEAVRPQVYDDATGKTIGPGSVVKGNPTIGVGILVGPGGGLLEHEIDYLEKSRIEVAFKAAQRTCPTFGTLTPNRQRVLVSMAFNMGSLSAFKRMLAAIAMEDWDEAARQMTDSRWAVQVGNRALELSQMMKEG